MLSRLVDAGNTVLVIEHNLDVVKTADWIIDLGPEGGFRGGTVVVEGTPEDIAAHPTSYTGQFLAPLLDAEGSLSPALPRPTLTGMPRCAAMRRLARPLLYVGIVVIVFGLAAVHAALVEGYDFTGTSRFGWSIAYCRAADRRRLRRGPARPAADAAPGGDVGGSSRRLAAALGISLVQLVVGDALLPRFVVFGSALLVRAVEPASASRSARTDGSGRGSATGSCSSPTRRGGRPP